MKLHLVEATEGDFEKLRSFITTTGYHWLYSLLPLEEKRKRINLARFPPKPRYGRTRYVTSSEKLANYSESDYLRRLNFAKGEVGGKIYIIYDSKKVVGYVYWRNVKTIGETQKIILDFPLEFDYQNSEAIRQIMILLKKKTHMRIYVPVAFQYAREIIKEVPDLHIGNKTV